MTDALRQLVESWRQEAGDIHRLLTTPSPNGAGPVLDPEAVNVSRLQGFREALVQCADDVELLMAVTESPSVPARKMRHMS